MSEKSVEKEEENKDIIEKEESEDYETFSE